MKRGLLGLLLLLAGLPLACGGGQELSPEAAVAEAAARTADSGSSRISFEAAMSGGGLPQAVEFSGEGEFDYESKRGRLHYDLGELLPGGGRVEVVMEGLVVYMKLPGELGRELPQGKEWLKLDLEALGAQAGIDIGALSQLNQGDPSQALLYLRGATDNIQEVGEEEVRGVATTHYRGRVDLRKAAEEAAKDAPAEARESIRDAIERTIELTGNRTVPVDVWIDDDGFARRFRTDFDLKVPGAQEAGHMVMTMELYDFGIEVDVEAPSAEKVIGLQELMEQGQEG
jgi:hypothetical protein